jgi:site-specific DNA-methyltransferase (adenine-specific)
MPTIRIANMGGLEYLDKIEKNSVDLVFTDPPYITSRDSGMDKWVAWTKRRQQFGMRNYGSEAAWQALKTQDEWKEWLQKGKNFNDPKKRKTVMRKAKENFLKYGSIYGTKYAVTTDYGTWDSEFKMEEMDEFVKEFYRVLRPGGTCIIFFDIWKISYLKEILESHKFKQVRFIEWVKTNPQPLNSSRNYLTNCREIALLAVKGGSPTFNSKYDNAVYEYPLQGGKYRIMPTQKNTALCEDLIKKHSNEGDLILDPFMGAATTAMAAYNTNRNAIGCELRSDMYDKSIDRIQGEIQWQRIQTRVNTKRAKRKRASVTASSQKVATRVPAAATKIIRNHTEDKENDFTISHVTR